MNERQPPYGLIKDRLLKGDVIPFLGAGASLSARIVGAKSDETGGGEIAGANLAASGSPGEVFVLPSANELAELLIRKVGFPEGEPIELAKVAQYFYTVGDRESLLEELHTIFSRDYAPGAIHHYLASIPVPMLIVTTNYDDLIERAFTAAGRPYDVVIHTTEEEWGDYFLWWPHGNSEPIEVTKQDLDIDMSSVSIIYKMHGGVDRSNPARDQYVITEDDYIDFLVRMVDDKAPPAIFAEPFSKRHFLFLGYSLSDWNLRVVLSRIQQRQKGKRASWAIHLNPREMERMFWDGRSVDIYSLGLDEFVKNLG